MNENEIFQPNATGRHSDTFTVMAASRAVCPANTFPLIRYDRATIENHLAKGVTSEFLLQDCETKKFMRCDSMWTADIDEALDFLSAQRAVCFGLKELKASFQILQIESNALSDPSIMIIPQLQWSKPSFTTRAACGQIVLPKTGRSSLQPLACETEAMAQTLTIPMPAFLPTLMAVAVN